ncbi:hypothetical protein [Enterobacter hormaechei]|uniref:hypothetical protein n=1 Tax=Enterobacter hormaechei TaxID=158836 RepID=UPI001FCEDD42|nr:hypothetical protein [Enterobacter hormaechei]
MKKACEHLSSEDSANKNVRIKIITKNEHHDFVLDARDKATKSIFIASHRISNNAERPILTPLITSMTANSSLNINMYYSSLSGGINSQQLDDMSNFFKKKWNYFREEERSYFSCKNIIMG